MSAERQIEAGSPNSVSECDLVSRARAGDKEAFGDLVRLHRSKAYGVAKSATRDHHLAEDIVQEAFIRAFLKLGTLTDINQFGPWLRRIVKNQTTMSLRRGGPHGKEQPTSDFDVVGLSDSIDLEKSERNCAGGLVDQLLSNVACTQVAEGPLEHLIRIDTIRDIRRLLNCLSKRERAIFEACFFEELKPDEIADRFQATTSSIYSHLSRSRRKVQRARLQFFVSAHVEQRKMNGRPRRNVIDLSRISFSSW